MPNSTLVEAVPTTPLTAGAVTLYTVPSGKKFTVAVLHLANVDTITRTIKACIVPPAGSSGVGNAVMWDFPLRSADVLELLRGDVWPDGTMFVAWCDSSGKVNVRLAGVESTP